MDNVSIVESIKKLCKNNNITVSQLEKNIGLSQGLVSKWINTTPSFDKIVDIANYFHVSLDEVVGYYNVVDDKFLEKLIKQTVDKTIRWNKYDKEESTNAKQYSNPDFFKIDFIDQNDINDYFETHKQISYFAKINNSFISIYGCYEYQNILNPSDIKLFIQPGDEANLIEQSYGYAQLKVLWLKVLYMLGDNAPDEIKAEEFKNSFINDFKKPEPIKKKKNVTLVPNVNITSPKQYRKPPKPLTSPKSMPLVDTTKTDSKDDNKQ